MPKKFAGTNTKSAEARSRKDAIKQVEKEKKERELEDALWKEDDKQVLRKQQRKDEKEKRKQELVDKKMAVKMAYDEEMGNIKSAKPIPTKLTRAEISAAIEDTHAKLKKVETVQEAPLEENVNRLQVDGEEARTIEDAISVLSIDPLKQDHHPEKRMKAAYQEFEDIHLPRLKAENPNLRLSQLKQMLKKDWMKSPENPMNQKH